MKQVKTFDSDDIRTQVNSENCGPPRGNKFDLEMRHVHSMVLFERACQKDHACLISILYHQYVRKFEQKVFCDRQTEGRTNELLLMSFA